MTNYDDEQRAMDAAIRDRKSGSVMQAAGWTLLIFGSITSVWIWVGFRSGSLFWFWWTLGLGVVGAGLVTWGTLRRRRAGKEFAVLSRTGEAPAASTADKREEHGGRRAA